MFRAHSLSPRRPRPRRGRAWPSRSGQPLRTFPAILLGAFVVGCADILDAIIFFGLRGVRPIRIFQSIAAGLMGRAAFQGGLPAAVLGGCLHYTNAFLIVSAFVLASRQVPALLRYPVITGILYGQIVYVVMNYVVIPLSATSRGAFSWPVVINGLLIHAFGVGIPSALAARAAARS